MRPPSVRSVGLVLAPLIVAESILGIVSAGANGGRGGDYLVAHLGAGLGLVGVSVWCLHTARRLPSSPARLATMVTAVALLATALTGAAFLVTASGEGLVVDRLLAVGALAGAVAMIATGGPSSRSDPSDRSREPGDEPGPPAL